MNSFFPVHSGPLHFPGLGGRPSSCQLEVYLSRDGREALACLIDGPHNHGTSTVIFRFGDTWHFLAA